MTIPLLIKMDLQLEIEDEIKSQISDFVKSLKLLPEDVAKLLFDKFLGLLDSSSLEIVKPTGISTSGTGNYVARLRIFGLRELIAAAIAAN